MKNKTSKIVILSGAGISAESGLGTFRDKGGLWDEYDINDVATPEAWEKDPELVLDFYNKRRSLVLEAKPNAAHYALVELENHYDVHIITQNIDDLHEKAGSNKIIHLHGEILKAQSVNDPDKQYVLNTSKIQLGDLAPDGHQLRPHVVWFGEAVPRLEDAEELIMNANVLIVIGTSLNVYPAANLIYACTDKCEKYIIDPNELSSVKFKNLIHIKGNATDKIPELVNELIHR
ncbi:MAG: NAD-dependent deacylase [Lentisphaeria bacterium]|nr:NAD-dependent deacylase [Lentisphaeria bacterium]